MSLMAVKGYLQTTSGASLAELCYHFDYDPETLRAMLALWVHKGKVRCWKKTSQCGGACQRCALAETELYCWQA